MTKEQIQSAINRAPEGCTHVVIVSDRYSYEYYPCYAKSSNDLEEILAVNENKTYLSTTEIYNLSLSIPDQLKERRAWNK